MPQLPPVTKALLLACVVVFCLQQFVHLEPLLALWPLTSGRFWPWELVTYAFLHGSPMHLFFNMLGLWMFGAELEKLWGRRRYQQLLLVSVLTAAVVQLLFSLLTHSRAYTVGASGGLYGLLLAYAVAFRHREFDLLGMVPMLLMQLPFPGADTLGMLLFVLMVANRSLVPIPPILVSSKVMVALFGAFELLSGSGFLTGRGSGVAHFAHLGGMLGAWLLIRWWRGGSVFGNPRRR